MQITLLGTLSWARKKKIGIRLLRLARALLVFCFCIEYPQLVAVLVGMLVIIAYYYWLLLLWC